MEKPVVASGSVNKAANVGSVERIVSCATGISLIVAALRTRSLQGLVAAVAGAALARRGITGHCALYSWLEIDQSRSVSARRVIRRKIKVNRPIEEVYAFWRNPENLARLSESLDVRNHDEHRSHWKLHGPANSLIEWHSDVIEERAPSVISWQSEAGTKLENAGSVRFERAPDGGTIVVLKFAYRLSPVALQLVAGPLSGKAVSQQIDHALDRACRLLEAPSSAFRQAPEKMGSTATRAGSSEP